MSPQPYDATFYDAVGPGSARSAAAIVPLVVNLIKDAGVVLDSVVDVGCGEGAWGAEFARHVGFVTGVDGDHVDRERLLIKDFAAMDLATERVVLQQRYELAVSLEVAEHLPLERARTFVDDLCGLAPIVLFSAACPKQGGTGHLNEQWPVYWAEHFWRNDYEVTGALRWLFWDDAHVEPWYSQNLIFAVRRAFLGGFEPALFYGPHALPISVVHPRIWEMYRT